MTKQQQQQEWELNICFIDRCVSMFLYLYLYIGRQCVHIHVYVHIKVHLCAYSILCLCCGQHLSLWSAVVFFYGWQSVDSLVSTLDLPGRCWQMPLSLVCLTSLLQTIRRSVLVSACVMRSFLKPGHYFTMFCTTSAFSIHLWMDFWFPRHLGSFEGCCNEHQNA